MKRTHFSGKLQAYASKNNPLQTIVEFVLTDFQPNKNNQCIPKSEAQNIVGSALNMPIKVHFKNDRVKGHAFSVPIGTLSEVWQENDVIMARSIIWKNEYPDIDEYLRKATSEGKMVGTSWEILYEQAKTENSITNLYGCLVQATTIVDDPAYGERTRILSIAESLNYMEELDTISAAFSNLLYVIDSLYAEVYQKQLEKTALEDASIALEKLKAMITDLRSSADHVTEMAQKLESATSENESLKHEKMALEDKMGLIAQKINDLEQEKAEAEKKQKEEALLEIRYQSLAEVGIVLSQEQKEQRRERYLAMSEVEFNDQINDYRTFARSVSIEVPDTLASNRNVSPKDIAGYIKNKKV